MARLLFRVEEAFALGGRRVLVPGVRGDAGIAAGAPIDLRFSDGRRRRTVVRAIQMPSPNLGGSYPLAIDLQIEVPPGTEVWSLETPANTDPGEWAS